MFRKGIIAAKGSATVKNGGAGLVPSRNGQRGYGGEVLPHGPESVNLCPPCQIESVGFIWQLKLEFRKH